MRVAMACFSRQGSNYGAARDIARGMPGVKVHHRLRMVMPDAGNGNANAIARFCTGIQERLGTDKEL